MGEAMPHATSLQFARVAIRMKIIKKTTFFWKWMIEKKKTKRYKEGPFMNIFFVGEYLKSILKLTLHMEV
ncbi:hypothetical protein GCM10020331_100030 [Ectobacillus funiculus]